MRRFSDMSHPSHSDTLSRCGLPTMQTLVRQILRTWEHATPSDIEAGAQWYAEAGALVDRLSTAHSASREQVAAVIAHLSPRTTWTRNVEGAVTFVETNGGKGTGIMSANHARALKSWNAPDPEETFGGPKTLRFYRNILGDSEAVTVDVWAARGAGIDETALGRVGVYDAIEHAYRLAARRAGVTPATMQATTWVVARGGRSQ